MMWFGHGDWGWAGWIVMSVTMLLFWGGLVTFAVWMTRRLPPSGGSGRADELLAERFARGDVDEDEYERRRELLHGGPRS